MPATPRPARGHKGSVYQVAFNSDGRRLVSSGTDGQVILWDAVTGKPLHRHRFADKTLCAAYSPDGCTVGTGTARAMCYLLELPQHVR